MNYTFVMARHDSKRALTGYRQRRKTAGKEIIRMVSLWSVLVVVSISTALLTPFHFA